MPLNEKWKMVIALARAANDKAEDAHLNAKGLSFLSVHEAMVKIQNGLGDDDTALLDIQDDVQEVYFGAHGFPFPSSNEIIHLENEILPTQSSDVVELIKQIQSLLDLLMQTLNEIVENKETTDGENDLAAALSHEIQHRRYFTQRILGG